MSLPQGADSVSKSQQESVGHQPKSSFADDSHTVVIALCSKVSLRGMATSATPLTEENDSHKSKWNVIQRIIQFSPGLLAIVYTLGFLIVSIHHGSYGVVMFEFLRVRIFAAGIIFVIFIAIPILVVSRLFGLFGLGTIRGSGVMVKTENIHFADACRICAFPLYFGVFANVASGLFGSPYLDLSDSRFQRLWIALLLLSAVSLIVSYRLWINRFPRWTVSIHIVSCVILVICMWKIYAHGLAAVCFWFSAMGLCFYLIHMVLKDKKQGHLVEWEYWVFFFLTALVLFSQYIYGRMLPAWGGGRPQPITINLKQSVPFASSGNVPAFLIDETDKGYYVVHKLDDHKASFIPRDTVGSVDFEQVK